MFCSCGYLCPSQVIVVSVVISCLCLLRNPSECDRCPNSPTEIMWIIVAHLKILLTLIKHPSAESNSWLSHKLIHKPVCKWISPCLQFLSCYSLCRWLSEPVAVLHIIHYAWDRSYRVVIKIPIFLFLQGPYFLPSFSFILQRNPHTSLFPLDRLNIAYVLEFSISRRY